VIIGETKMEELTHSEEREIINRLRKIPVLDWKEYQMQVENHTQFGYRYRFPKSGLKADVSRLSRGLQQESHYCLTVSHGRSIQTEIIGKDVAVRLYLYISRSRRRLEDERYRIETKKEESKRKSRVGKLLEDIK
jgi:hypothetical protein